MTPRSASSAPRTPRELVISRLGEFRFAFDAAEIGSITDVDAETIASEEFYDLGRLLGTPPLKGQRRMLEVTDGNGNFLFLLVGRQVRLESAVDYEAAAPPEFLDHLWRNLHVRALLPTDPPALLLDLGALMHAAQASRAAEENSEEDPLISR